MNSSQQIHHPDGKARRSERRRPIVVQTLGLKREGQLRRSGSGSRFEGGSRGKESTLRTTPLRSVVLKPRPLIVVRDRLNRRARRRSERKIRRDISCTGPLKASAKQAKHERIDVDADGSERASSDLPPSLEDGSAFPWVVRPAGRKRQSETAVTARLESFSRLPGGSPLPPPVPHTAHPAV